MTSLGQNKKFSYQLNLGPTASICDPRKISESSVETTHKSGFGYFFEFSVSCKIRYRLEFVYGINHYYNKIKRYEKIGSCSRDNADIITKYNGTHFLFKYKLSKNIPFYIAGGPYLGLLLSAKERHTEYYDFEAYILNPYTGEYVWRSLHQKYSHSIDKTKEYNKLDYGFTIQTEYKKQLTPKLEVIFLTRVNYELIKNVIASNNYNSKFYFRNINLFFGIGIEI